MHNQKPILLVEDDQVDALTVRRAFKELHIANRLDLARDGVEALELLNDQRREKPGLILLDLNMPRMNGFEFLKARRQDPTLRRIPVVVLTTSQEDRDRVETFDLCIAGYMLKPVDYRKFVETIRAIDMYWTLSEKPD